MSSRKRITAALVGLILLVVVGWFVRERTEKQPPAPARSSTVSETSWNSMVEWDVRNEVAEGGGDEHRGAVR